MLKIEAQAAGEMEWEIIFIKSVLSAKIKRACLDLCHKHIVVRHAAMHWLCDDSREFLSFPWMCEFLRLDHASLLNFIINNRELVKKNIRAHGMRQKDNWYSERGDDDPCRWPRRR